MFTVASSTWYFDHHKNQIADCKHHWMAQRFVTSQDASGATQMNAMMSEGKTKKDNWTDVHTTQ